MKYKILTLAILSLVFLSAETKIFGQKTEILIKNAEAAIENKEYDSALKTLNIVLTKEPGNADALTQKSRVLYFQGKSSEAIAEAGKAIAADPNNSVAYNVRGLAKKDSGKDPNGALADFEKAVALDPKNPKALINRGMMYWNFERFDAALADINRAVELAPSSDSFYYIRGGFYHFRKEYAKAIEDYTKAIELAPENGNYYGNRAETYLAQSKNITDATVSLATADAEKALSLNPQNGRALFVRGQIRYYTGDEIGALTDILAARKLNPNLTGFDKVYNWNWSKSPDNLRLELVELRLTKLKAEFENDLTDYDKQLRLEIAFRDVPPTARQNDAARFTFDGYLDALLKNDPNNPCLNRYRLIKTNVESAGKEVWRLPQYETDAAKLTDAATAEKFKSCAAGIARDVAFKRYEIASRKLSQSFAENFEKSAGWATKANQIFKGAGDDVLNSLEKLAEEFRDFELGSMKGDPRYADHNNRVIGEYSKRKARIRLARAESGSTLPPSSDTSADTLADARSLVEPLLAKSKTLLAKYKEFDEQYEQKYRERSIGDRLLDGPKYFMTADESAQFLSFRKEFDEIINEYKNFLARYENVTLSDGKQVPVTNLKEILSRFNKHLERVNVQLKFAGL